MIRTFIRFGACVLMAGSLTGCRFGNQVVPAPNPDKISGYYESQPQELELCSQNSPTATTLCAPVATNQTPAMIGSVMEGSQSSVFRSAGSGSFWSWSTVAETACPLHFRLPLMLRVHQTSLFCLNVVLRGMKDTLPRSR